MHASRPRVVIIGTPPSFWRAHNHCGQVLWIIRLGRFDPCFVSPRPVARSWLQGAVFYRGAREVRRKCTKAAALCRTGSGCRRCLRRETCFALVLRFPEAVRYRHITCCFTVPKAHPKRIERDFIRRTFVWHCRCASLGWQWFRIERTLWHPA